MTFASQHSQATTPSRHASGASRLPEVLTQRPAEVVRLQHLIGNKAMARLLQRQLGGGTAGVTVGNVSSSLSNASCSVMQAVAAVSRGSTKPAHRSTTAPRALQRELGGGFREAQAVRNALVEKTYEDFVTNAKGYGMPVKFLADVSKTTTMHDSDENLYNATFGWLNLGLADVGRAARMAPMQKVAPTLEIYSIYHESTHAYLYKHRTTQPIKEFYERGTRYYEGAPTAKRRITSDAEEVFQEACAGYVGKRAAAWWLAFSLLSQLVARSSPPKPTEIENIASRYDSVMSERVIGYSSEGGFWSKEQDRTTRPISQDMKAFLDRELLEGLIADKFDDVPSFKGLRYAAWQ